MDVKPHSTNQHQDHTNHPVLFNSFFPRTVRDWNHLSSDCYYLGNFTPVVPELLVWRQPPLLAANSHSPMANELNTL